MGLIKKKTRKNQFQYSPKTEKHNKTHNSGPDEILSFGSEMPQSTHASEVFPFLYLGAEADLSESAIERSRITHVLNATKTLARPSSIDNANFKRIPVLDSNGETILSYLDECVDFIDQRRQANERVLVHCVAGISRSATISIAYTMKHLNMTVDKAYDF